MGVDVLVGDERQAVFRNRVVEALDLARDHRDLADHLALHGTGVGLLLKAALHHFADVEDRHVVLGLQRGNRPLLVDHQLHLVLDAGQDLGVVDRHGVDLSLLVEQLLRHERLEGSTNWRAYSSTSE